MRPPGGKLNPMKRLSFITLALALAQPSCIVAGGYSSRDGWFFWPWGLLLPVAVVVALFLLRRRR